MINYIKNPSRLSKITFVYEGSNMEEESEAGCTHLLEHLMFKKTLEPLESELAKKGISMNAETSYMSTLYYVEGLDKYLKNTLSKFMIFLLIMNLILPKKNSKKRRKLLLQNTMTTFLITQVLSFGELLPKLRKLIPQLERKNPLSILH